MSQTMFELSVPRFTRIMKSLTAILEKAVAYSEEKNIAEKVLPGCRLVADMHPLSTQVQFLSDQCKGSIARLAGVEVPSYEDTETTLAELIERMQKTIDFIGGFTPDQINDTEKKIIELRFPQLSLDLPGAIYLMDFTYPNVYFHYTTAYNILRANGLEIGKRDFIGAMT